MFRLDILVHDIPGLAGAADAETLALADGVVHGAFVPAFVITGERAHFARLCRQVAFQKTPEVAFANKADAGRILAVMIGQTGGTRQGTHFSLGEMADREQSAGKLGLAERVEKIGLVLGGVGALEQLVLALPASRTCA